MPNPPGPARRWLRAAVTANLLLAAVAGCDSSGIGRTYPVRGTILVDGEPALGCGGTVALYPNAEKGNTTSFDVWANLNEDGDGAYTVYTKGPGGSKAGAPPGWYKVTVSVFPVQGRLDPKNKRTLKQQIKVNPKYWSPKTSKLEIEVVESPATGAYDLRVGAADP
jgi:hypothetical protein